MAGSVVVGGARTPIGKLGGSLSSLSATALGSLAIAEALRRAGIGPEVVDRVVMGQVIQAGQGQNPARQAAVGAGVPMSVPAMTINKVCLSGLQALRIADLLIASGEADVVVAGGMESMSQAPYLLEGARAGLRYGDAPLRDSIVSDGLTCAFDHDAMGAATERYAAALGIARERQDGVALRSHERAAEATKSGRLAEEIVAVEVRRRGSDAVIVDEDEGVRPETTLERLAGLRPAFSSSGSVTAGNASQLSDGAAALVLMSPEAASRLGVRPLAEVIAYGEVAGPDPSLLTQPSRAIAAALARCGLGVSDLDVIEVNEAFAAVALAAADDLGVDVERLNPNGGAIALGHPIGMSGARLALSAVLELARSGGGVGAVGICGGGGQGDAVVLRSLRA